MSALELTMMKRIGELKAELTVCKAEADRLKAEVERLRASSFVTAVPVEQYERVVKAGDGMYSWLGVCGRVSNSFGDDWLRAKKGAMLEAEQFDLDMKNRGWNGWNAAKAVKQS